MRKSVLLVPAVLLLGAAAPALADGPKPQAILSLASHDKVKMAADEIAFVKDTPGLPTWFSSFVELYAQGRDVAGLAKDRPWGVVVQETEKLSGYAFVPVADLQALRDELSSYIGSVSDEGNGVYKVVGTEEGKQLYAREANGWLFVSDRAEVLATVCTDPATLVEGLDRTYDVAVRLVLRNVPEAQGKALLRELDRALGATLRKATSEKAVEALGQAAFELDEVTLGWSKR